MKFSIEIQDEVYERLVERHRLTGVLVTEQVRRGIGMWLGAWVVGGLGGSPPQGDVRVTQQAEDRLCKAQAQIQQGLGGLGNVQVTQQVEKRFDDLAAEMQQDLDKAAAECYQAPKVKMEVFGGHLGTRMKVEPSPAMKWTAEMSLEERYGRGGSVAFMDEAAADSLCAKLSEMYDLVKRRVEMDYRGNPEWIVTYTRKGCE